MDMTTERKVSNCGEMSLKDKLEKSFSKRNQLSVNNEKEEFLLVEKILLFNERKKKDISLRSCCYSVGLFHQEVPGT
jgi:hypothetical protein